MELHVPAGLTRKMLRLRQVIFELIQSFVPPLLAHVALRARFERSMMQREPCPVALLVEGHREQRFLRPVGAHAVLLRRDRVAFFIRKGIGADDLLRPHDLAIDALPPILLSVGRAHAVMKDASRAQIDLADGRRESFRTPPAHQALGLGPRLENLFARRIEKTRDYECILLRLYAPGGTGCSFSHGYSPFFSG